MSADDLTAPDGAPQHHLGGDEPPANFIDVKLHGVFQLPASWATESGAAPVFNDHVFRYEVDIDIAGVTHTFQNGRVLQAIPLYTDFVAAAKLPPVVPNLDDEDVADDDVPSAAPLPPRPTDAAAAAEADEAATPPETARTTASGGGDEKPAPSGAPTAVMWVLGPEVDTEVKEETGKKDSKPAPKKGAAAAPPPPPEVVKPILPDARAPPPCVARFPLSLSQLSTFEEQVESLTPLTLTFRRIVRSGAPADWEDTLEAKYVAKMDVSLKALSEPGSRQLEAEVPLAPAAGDGAKDDDKGGKGGAKKAAPKKAKGTAPAALTEDVDPSESHPYVANKTYARITLAAHNPVTRLPQGRPRPDLQPSDMIPKRLLPPRRPVEATKHFTREVEGLVARIVRDFRAHREAHPAGAPVEDLRASFLMSLSTSGRSRVYQDLLVPSVQGIVKETFIRKSSPTPEEMDKVSNELYTYLLDHTHLTLNRSFAPPSAAEASAGLDGDPVDRWRRLAMEAEVMQELGMAARYHQERLVQCRDRRGEADLPDVWCEYAEFCLRVRDALKAEQGYREALAIDMAHLPSLVGYGALLLSRQRFREAEVYLQSAVDVSGNAITWGSLALYYDALLVTIADSPHEETRRAVCRRESKYAMSQAVRTGGDASSSAAEVFEALGKHLLTLHLEELANLCLSRAPQTPAVTCLVARVFKQTNQHDEAAAVLLDVLAADPQNAEAHMLLGDVYAGMPGKSSEAEQQYDAALRIDPHSGSGPSYVRLGNMYVALGKHKDALSAFLMGAKAWPCGLTWLGVGIAYYRMDDLVRAEQALSESNVLNSLNPKTWAYLALVCLRQRRDDEGDQAFNQAIKQSLADPHLIAEVGSEQLRLGRHKIAEACFRRALALDDDCNTRMHLARTLALTARAAEAREEYAYVARHTTNEAQRARAEEQIAGIPVE